MTSIRNIALTAAAALAVSAFAAPLAYADKMHDMAGHAADVQAPAKFVKKSKSIRGDVSIVNRDGRQFVVFSDNFKARSGPDLKVFLSPHSVKQATGRNATKGAINLGELKTTKGGQEYEIPAGVNVADFGSVLVHCEAYAVLWGGAAV